MTDSDFSAYSWVATFPEEKTEEEEQEEPFRCFCGEPVTAYNNLFLRCTCGKFWTRKDIGVPESNTFTEQDLARVNYHANY